MEICSMTGFGRAEHVTDDYRIAVEIKSVNHRYFDLSTKIPRRMASFESRIRSLLKEYIDRGKTDIFITYEDYTDRSRHLVYNRDIASEYMGYLKEISESFDIKGDISASALSRFPEVLTMEESFDDDDRLWTLLEPVIREAAERFRENREKEGMNLKKDLLEKLGRLDACVTEIEGLSPSVVESYRQRLKAKIEETLADTGIQADEGRIITEVTIYADKVCTDEEMVRLKSHIDAVRKKLNHGGACGRELDFIAQEMNREANTTLSKANNLKIADTAIALKTEIEKIREQVQNIE